MNNLLLLNKKIVLVFSILIFFSIILFLLFQLYLLNNDGLIERSIKISNVDITQPKFAINNSSQQIFITAKEGNFISKDKILLRKDVKFKSNEFSIESDNVMFDRKKQTASSDNQSLFKTKSATISSDGFNIYDKGNKINFSGNTVVILK